MAESVYVMLARQKSAREAETGMLDPRWVERSGPSLRHPPQILSMFVYPKPLALRPKP